MFGASRFFRNAGVMLFVGIAWGWSSVNVQAASTYSVWYNADVLAQGAGATQDRMISVSGNLPQTSLAAPQFNASITGVARNYGIDWTQEASATWNGTAASGSLSGASSSHASVSPVTATVNSYTYTNPYSATGFSQQATTGGLGWSDTATVVSGTLAVGTAVDLRFTLRMDSQIDLGGAPVQYLDTGNRAFADSRFTLGAPGSILLSMKQDTGAYGWSNSANTLVTTGLGASSNEISRILHVTVGQAVPIGGWLSTYAKSVATAGKPDMTASASANSYYYIDVITAGASYTTASGTSYLSPVPLPSAVWLLGSGVAGLTGLARRKARW